jgi:outer membrane receptor protein involved in Fe transport
MKSGKRPAIALAAAVVASLVPGVCYAVLEEVIVTAQKREQNVQSIPIAVTALGEDTIRNANILNIDDVANHTPGFTISNYNPVTPQPFIRGVGSMASTSGGPVAIAPICTTCSGSRFCGAHREPCSAAMWLEVH